MSYPDLGALELFLTATRLGSVSQAAAAHRIAQPSASSRITTLERQLGIKLLERGPRGSVPTSEGSVVAGWAENLLRVAQELTTGVEALRASRTGQLRVAASFTIAEYLLPPWLDKFLRSRPDDSVALDVVNSTHVLERVDAGQADLGFIESPDPTPTMRSQTVAVDELVTVVRPGHPWTRGAGVSVDTLVSTPLVLREQGSGTRASLEQALAVLGLDAPYSVLEVGSTSAVRSAVRNGSSPTVVSGVAVAADLDAGTLVAVPVAGLSIRRRLRAVWPRRRDLNPLAQALLDQIPNLP